jgi:hypothetical protein
MIATPTSRRLPLPLVLLAALLLAACSRGSRREVVITIRNDTCTPTTVQAAPGEQLQLVLRSEATEPREVEGIEGTQLEEVIVRAGETRTVKFTMPTRGGPQKVKCYIPGGPSTIITIESREAPAQ